MPALVCNIAKGREVELYERVNTNDPANSALVLVVLAEGAESLETMQNYDTLSTLLAASPEVTNTNYVRKTWTDADLAAWTPDDTANSITLTLPIKTWSGPAPAAGDNWEKGVVAYDSDTTGGTDANIIPVIVFDIFFQGSLIVPDGNPIDIDFSGGFVSAV